MSLIDPRPILIVEDSDEDFEATLWALKKVSVEVPITRCIDGELAIDYLEKRGKYANVTHSPAIILLDLNLPRTSGHQVLQHIKTSSHLRLLPVIVFTSSKRSEDIQFCYQNGSNSYVAKPVGSSKLRELVHGLVGYWFQVSLLPETRASEHE